MVQHERRPGGLAPAAAPAALPTVGGVPAWARGTPCGRTGVRAARPARERRRSDASPLGLRPAVGPSPPPLLETLQRFHRRHAVRIELAEFLDDRMLGRAEQSELRRRAVRPAMAAGLEVLDGP